MIRRHKRAGRMQGNRAICLPRFGDLTVLRMRHAVRTDEH